MKCLTRIAIPAAFLLAACGDDITEINANVGAVKSSDDLPACTEDIAGQTAYIKETHEFLGCDGKEWQTLSANTVNVGDNVCTSTSLSDGSGFEIFCNGESIGTVKNGKDGEKGDKGDTGDKGADGAPGTNGTNGKDGAPGTNGTNGKDGAPGTNGTNGKDGAGCKIQESTELTATIACGSETFTMDLTGYVDVPEECDATDDACTVPSGDVELSGVSQKGPFVSGTDVTAYELENGKSLKQTGKTFGGKIENKDGSFNIRTVKLRSTYTYLVADGFYRNEVTGKNSAATIKLRALTNLDGRSVANINLVTHLEYDRVQRLVTKENKSVIVAKRAAEKSLFKAFGIDNSNFRGFAEDYNILQEGDSNAALLAVSVLLQGDRNESELTALLAALSVDLGDNGEWDDSLRRAQVADWAMKADIEGRLATVRANIEGWKLVDSKAPAFEQHVTNFWMQELGVDKCDSSNAGALFATKNKKSAYYAANDSTYTDGDSSLVRLICAASGDSFAWRFATDIEKDVAAFTAADDGAVKRGSVDTTNVYVKENGAWRRGTELDASLDAACVADNKGMTDSLIVEREPVWYICDKNDDASDSFAWRKATTAEADTALFGTPGEGDAIVKLGNVNKSLVYVFEDVDGNGNAKWRYGTVLDLDSDLGPCTSDKVDGVVRSSKNMWFKCVNDGNTLVEGEPVPTEWREATNYEKDTYGLEGTLGDYQQGNVNKNLYYVKENGYWRPATDLERTELGACTEAQNDAVKKITVGAGESWYKCSNDISTVIDTFRVAFSWRSATDIEKDTVGWAAIGGWKKGDVRNGKVNTEQPYVFQDGAWRVGTALDSLLKQGCVVEGDTSKNKVNKLYYVCTFENIAGMFVNRKWVVAPDIYNTTKDLRSECRELGAYGFGNIVKGLDVSTGYSYVCENGKFRLVTSTELMYDRVCVGYLQGLTFKVNDSFRKCSNNKWYSVYNKDTTGIMRDKAGREYKTVVIGAQQWMKENMDYVTDGSSCYIETYSNYCNKGRGHLYVWETAMTVCPIGWHLPSSSEWSELFAAVGGNDVAGKVLKAKSDWINLYGSDGNGTDVYNFTVLPGGYWKPDGTHYIDGSDGAFFWTSTEKYTGDKAYYVGFGLASSVSQGDYPEGYAMSVRCIQDN
ncbi:major paralogous domain-containing protein [Fibrobacter sp. UWR3]|uniref:FISUMP domain-containing protein n=1 Tax=Fibrobacter sp. UWR3 TaxID=1896217 RepID=UPI00091884F3|nr:FISUMP domain-containing protein [Fibrobacter sp. UWR3]SHM34694.1 major paralogous domain-containing protein [Fibrobacter sp. UWR3]